MKMKETWNSRYQGVNDIRPQAASILAENHHLLPEAGHALDLACGLGGNALLLAEKGLDVEAWDISDIAIQKLAQRAEEEGLRIHAQIKDLEMEPVPESAFDVITVSYYLDRNLFEPLLKALRPGGLVFYQTFSLPAVSCRGPSNPDYRLKKQELLEAFSPLQVVLYREESNLGNHNEGFRDEAMFIGYKP